MPLFIEPHAGPAPIIHVIATARHEVNLNVYYLSDRPILAAIKAAEKRGVTVRVMLDGKPYGMKPWQVSKEIKEVKQCGAQVKLAPERFESSGTNYRFDHGKWVASLHEVEIGTANDDWSAFHRNREYLYLTRNQQVVRSANAVFNADWNNTRAPVYAHQILVLSPGTSAGQMISVIDQPGNVDIESEEMGPYSPTLDAIAAKGRLARVILPANINAEGKRDVAFLKSRGVQVRLLPLKPVYNHAKMIAGKKEAFIGSENFTETSLEKNREMGLLLDGQSVGELEMQFEKDWQRAN